MSMEKLQRLVELDANRAELETQTAAVVAEMREIIGEGFKIAGAKVVPVKRGVGSMRVPEASPPLLGAGSFALAEPPSNGDRRSTKERILAHLSGCGDSGASIPDVMHALGLRAGPVSSAMLELKAAHKIVRVSRGVYAAKT